MKIYKNISKNLLVRTGAICLVVSVLSSCLKNHNSYYNPPAALVTFIQASPDQPALDFYLDNDRVNSRPVNYGNTIDYFNAYTGKRTANFYSTGTKNKIFSDTVHFNPNLAYSLFLANKASSPELVLLKDSISRPASGNANIRFINLSPDAPAVDLAVKGKPAIVSNKAYKGYSSFLPIKGDTTYTFEVHKSGSNTVLASITNIKLNNGFVYTIWFHGLAAPVSKSDSLTTSILTNAYYH
jgi:hypothetical protein